MLRVQGLYTEYPNERGEIVKAAQDVTFNVPEGQLFTLLGPSGCGKTTTLRSIAGLEKPRVGEIAVKERVVYSSAKGVFITQMPRAVAALISMLSTPMPARPITFRFLAAVITSAVALVAERTARPS